MSAIYGIKENGDLCWYWFEIYFPSLEVRWTGPYTVATGWGDFKTVFRAGFNSIYAVTENGDLLWYQHSKGVDDLVDHWANERQPQLVGTNWGDFKTVFGDWGGIIYAVTENDDLLWYKHEGVESGADAWQNGGQPTILLGPYFGRPHWGYFKTLFSAGVGTIYGIRENGDLAWYRHLGRLTGLDDWTDQTTKWVGIGWEDFKIVLGYTEGQIFGVQENGDLMYYFHRGAESGTNDWENEGHPFKVGNGWDIFKTVF